MVTPPTLNAASPVGAVTAHKSDSLLSWHVSHTRARIVLIRKDLPVPPTPLLCRLDAAVIEIPCIDEVNESTGKFKWSKKATED